MKWKNFTVAYGSIAMLHVYCDLFGPAIKIKLLRSISLPTKTYTIGSYRSIRLMVAHIVAEPLATEVDHISLLY